MTRKVFNQCMKSINNGNKIQYISLYKKDMYGRSEVYMTIFKHKFYEDYIEVHYTEPVPSGIKNEFGLMTFKKKVLKRNIKSKHIDEINICSKEEHVQY